MRRNEFWRSGGRLACRRGPASRGPAYSVGKHKSLLQRNFIPPGKMPGYTAGQRPAATAEAFTLVELVSIVAVVGLLTSVLAPALGKIKPSGESIQCLSNTKQLIAAWQMYALDNRDSMMPVVQGGE